MLCAEIMKGDVHCISPRDTAEDAARAMRDQNLGFLPVCDQSGKIVGAVTDRDITIRLVADNRPGTTAIEEVLTREVISCSPHDNIRHAEMLMAKNHKSRIMCVDESGKLVGVISLSDIAQREHSRRVADTLRQVSEREIRV